MSKKCSTFAPAFEKQERLVPDGAPENFNFWGKRRARRKFI